jgi:hypothetical protein
MSDLVLIYNGREVERRGDMLNLTSMWRSSGEEANKRPVDWLRSSQAREFMAFLEGVGISHCLERAPGNPRTGDGGTTWAHWQVGMAYAKYLSPEFHAWCNQVVRARMEQLIKPALGLDVGAALIEGMRQAVAPVLAALAEGQGAHSREIEVIRTKVDHLQATLDTVVQRRPVSAATKQQHLIALRSMGGRCPCCGLTEIIAASSGSFVGEWDHFYARNRNKAHETWPICTGCHRKRTNSRNWIQDERATFDGYQSKLAKLSAPLLLNIT